MSYILEALQRSQQAREQGQVPRLERLPLLDAGRRDAGARVPLWAWVLMGLSALAVAISLYAALRPAVVPILPPLAAQADVVTSAVEPPVAPLRPVPDAPSAAATRPPPLPARESGASASPPADLVAEIEAFKEAVRREQNAP
ncbi:MAG: hypothetical protein JXM75_01410 [Chromatiaceae bacterium]|nr:hypothetical protein [Chromatiaceae bacterium]